jgi:hypothetical protein
MALIAALTASFNAIEAQPDTYDQIPVAAGVTVFTGSILAIDAAGNANPASDTVGLHVLGRCEGLSYTQEPQGLVGSDGVNTGGAAGAIVVTARPGVFRWQNSTTNPVTQAMIGEQCYVEADSAVASSSNHFIVAGIVKGVDANGVWVDTRRAGAQAGIITLTSAQNATAAAVDLPTSEALANALKAGYNALQADVAALVARLG